MPLFGGIDRETGYHVAVGAFQKGFAQSRCISAWAKVGAATTEGITRACLDDPQVMKALGDDEDTDKEYAALQIANDLAV